MKGRRKRKERGEEDEGEEGEEGRGGGEMSPPWWSTVCFLFRTVKLTPETTSGSTVYFTIMFRLKYGTKNLRLWCLTPKFYPKINLKELVKMSDSFKKNFGLGARNLGLQNFELEARKSQKLDSKILDLSRDLLDFVTSVDQTSYVLERLSRFLGRQEESRISYPIHVIVCVRAGKAINVWTTVISVFENVVYVAVTNVVADEHLALIALSVGLC